MTGREFYNRTQELAMLRDRYAKLESGDMIAMYGRRRVGKTELVRQFMNTASGNRLYFYVDLTEKRGLLDMLAKAVQEQLKDTVRFSDFDDFLEYVGSKADAGRFILVIDEFQRLLEIAPQFITTLQHHWDSRLKDKKIMLILVGSSIGMMQRITGSRAGALYGRATKAKISPFRYADFRSMFKDASEEERVVLYSVFGGTPYYLEKVRKTDGGVHRKIFELFLKKGAELAEEPKNLLDYESVRVHAKYNAILQAASSGKNTLKEICDFTKINANVVPAYIRRLDQLLDLMGRSDPVLGKERLGRYCLRDNLFRFWFRFIFPNQTPLNIGNTKLVSDCIKDNLNGYVGRVFEGVVMELLASYMNKKIKGIEIDFEGLGSWWNRSGEEIDIVAYNRRARRIMVGEVKWTSQPLGVDVIDGLTRKSKLIGFGGEYRLLFVSKSGFTPQAIKRMDELGALYLDLDYMAALFDALQS